MSKKLVLLLSMLCYTLGVGAQHNIYLTLENPAIVSYVNGQGKPVFTISGINSLINQYTVTGFGKAFPDSRFQDVRRIYKMQVSSLQLPVDLTTSYSQYFPSYEVIPPSMIAYTPVDYPNLSPFRNTDYLGYINAQAAWDVTKGDPSVIIGITDTYLDTTHPDLKTKYVGAFPNVLNPFADTTTYPHGTIVAGLAAGSTDTSIGSPFYGGYPSIGFQCKIDFSAFYATSEMLKISKRPGRRVLNGSWLDSVNHKLETGTLADRRAYQEIYENGVFACFAAGNSDPNITPYPWLYGFPASYDYVFSVSGVNHVNTSGTYNVKGMHEATIGDSIDRVGFHNTRVDLLAPYNDIGGLTYDPNNPNTVSKRYKLNNSWGSSWASPIVAGTAALILSVDKCFTPYQVEYILKKSANASILTLTPNQKYAGRLGAGALDAGEALAMVEKNGIVNPQRNFKTNCNDPATTTFFIEGIDINMICAPGYSSNGVKPVLTPVLRNGNPSYTYRWEYMPGNNVTLSSLTAAAPTITASTGNRKAVLRLTVYDGSSIQKVASRYFTIQLTTANTYDFAGIDSYMDMLNEPNLMDSLDRRDNNFYMSPDLWNRQTNDGLTEHENAEYYANPSNFNYAHARVRNIGCAVGGNNYLKLYWTVASTGENWKNDWDGTTTVAGSVVGSQLPGGGEITGVNWIWIVSVLPGQDTVIVVPWRPVNPQDYQGAPNDLNVCLLARIVNPSAANEGMTIPEVVGKEIINNVRPNNNIFTRNLWVKDLNSGNRSSTTRILISNASEEAQVFDVQFINDRAIHLHFAGNFSAIGYVKLHLGDLYDLWMEAGAAGSYLEKNDDEKWVTMDGSQTLELLNLSLPANAKYPVDVEFTLYPGVELPNYRYDFHLRQFGLDSDGFRLEDAYGSMSFRINTVNTDAMGRKAAQPDKDVLNETASAFSVHPNPASDKISVSYLSKDEVVVNVEVFDVTGRKLTGKENQHFQNSFIELNVADYAPGVYFVNISNGKNINDRIKFIKR